MKKKNFTVFSGLRYKKRKEKSIDSVYVKENGRKEGRKTLNPATLRTWSTETRAGSSLRVRNCRGSLSEIGFWDSVVIGRSGVEVMTTVRRFCCDDLLRFANVNVDHLTETVHYLLPVYVSSIAPDGVLLF